MEEKSSFKGTHRIHLTKEQRLPKFIKDAEKVITSVKSCKSNFKTVLANSRFRGNHFKKVYSLTLNVLKHYDYIQCLIKEVKLLDKEENLRRELATILIYEVIFGRGQLSGESKPVITINNYIDELINAHQKLQHSYSFSSKGFDLPRYARIHTLVTTVPYVVKDLEDIGFHQMFYDADITEEKFVELVKCLESGSFMVDLHFKDLLVFAHGENLLNLELYKKGHIFLQDKSSCIPVHALNPEPGSAILDACAAPGMKALHIAAKMKNKGILLACERDKARFETLKEMIQHGNVKISKLFCKDFKLMDPDDQAYCSIDYILLDPSCSGSGMVNRMDSVTDTDDSKNKERLQKLAGFQIILLKHALKFPSVKRVVYSTCSIDEEENEYVVHEALNAFYNSFKLVSVMPEWSTRGFKTYEHGELCLRTLPEKHLTNGFFVAMFERLDGSENYADNFQMYEELKKKIAGKKRLDMDQNEENVNVDAYSSTNKKRSKYLHDSQLSSEVEKEVSLSGKRNTNDLCNTELRNAVEEEYEGISGSSEVSKHLLSSFVPKSDEKSFPEHPSKHKKKRKHKENRYEHEDRSACQNQEICTDMDLLQKCDKNKKHKTKDIKMEKYENMEESNLYLEGSHSRKISLSVEVEFQNSGIVDGGSIKHKKKKKHRNESEKIEVQEVMKETVGEEFLSTKSRKRKHKKEEMLNCDGDNLSKEISRHESQLTSFGESADNIESDVIKHKKKRHHKYGDVKDCCDNTQALTSEEVPEICENLERFDDSLTREKKRKKHKKHAKEKVENAQVEVEEIKCFSVNITDNTDNNSTKQIKKKHEKHSKEYANEKNTSQFNENYNDINSEVKEESMSFLIPESINDMECEPTKHKKSKKHKKHARDA